MDDLADPSGTSRGHEQETFSDPSRLAARLGSLARAAGRRHLLVGLSGLEAAGKSTVADELARALSSRHHVLVIRGDWFSRSKAERNADPDAVTGYLNDAYDYDYLVSRVLKPLREAGCGSVEFDAREPTDDSVSAVRLEWPGPTIVLVEGVLLFRGTISSCFDYRVWIDVDFTESRHRASRRVRDLIYYKSVEALQARYDSRFHPAQRIHIERDDPIGTAHGVLLQR